MHLNLEVAAVICIEVGGARNYNPLHRVMGASLRLFATCQNRLGQKIDNH